MVEKNITPAVGIPQLCGNSTLPNHKGCEAKEVLYVRSDLLDRFRNSPLLAMVVITAAEFERLCKTRIGRVYVSSFQWQTCSPQSLF